MSDTPTLIGVECDPACKWKFAALDMVAEKATKGGQVPTHDPYNEGSQRPTAEGYATLEQLDTSYTGLQVLVSVAKNCRNACAIEGYIDSHPDAQFGATVADKIKDLKG